MISHVARRLPQRTPLIFYDSFGGQFADTPRALFETAMDSPDSYGGLGRDFGHVWCLREDVPTPSGAQAVRPESAEFAWVISRANIVFANSGLPRYFQTRPGCTFVQTWHGTPLKRIGFDIEQPTFAGHDKYFQRLKRDVERWDMLISPNSFSTEIFRSAFRFEGRILETGYPRNDILVGPDVTRRRAEVRSALGLTPTSTAVLYAPTWRDEAIDESGQQAHTLALDPQKIADCSGTDTKLLLRLHPLVARSHVPEGPGVLNVSSHPDMRELLLAADVLITDYSSSMFDFAVTGKPLIFYAYDLERYADGGRGFYFDLLAESPGPVVRTEAEVIEALRALDSLSEQWAPRYAAFQARFCHLDDGHASERVLQAVLNG
jgi:CDP-glycerol glycerophosphotransferase